MIEVNTDPRFSPLTEEEIRAQYLNELGIAFNAELDAFGEQASAIRGAGDRLFWLSLDQRLHSYDVSSMNRVDYEIPVASEVFSWFRPGEDAVLKMTLSADEWQFSAYAVEEPNTLIDMVTWPSEGVLDLDGEIVPPVAVDDGDVYLLDPGNVLYRWRPGTGAPEPRLSLAEKGFALGTIRRFSVHGDDVLVLDDRAAPSMSSEGFDLWHVVMTTGEVQQVAEFTYDTCFNAAGDALYLVWPPDGLPQLRQYSSSDRRTEDMDALLRQTSMDLGDITLSFDDEDMAVYEFQCQPGGFTLDTARGLFFFDPKKLEAQPIFLQTFIIPDGKFGSTQAYIRVALVERVAFLTVERCTLEDVINPCSPPAIYRRDLSAQ